MRSSIYAQHIPPRVSGEQLPCVQVTPYHPHNSVNLGDGLGHLHVYTLYSNGDNCPPCLIQFEQRNVINNELPHRTINS